MKEELINKAYEIAKERYAALGLDVEKVMEQLQKVSISMHCWRPMMFRVFEICRLIDRWYPDYRKLSR